MILHIQYWEVKKAKVKKDKKKEEDGSKKEVEEEEEYVSPIVTNEEQNQFDELSKDSVKIDPELIKEREDAKKRMSPDVKKLLDEANELQGKARQLLKTAGVLIKEAYNHAVQVDGLYPQDARKMLYAYLKYTPQWIRKFIPQEAKQQQAHNRELEISHRNGAKSLIKTQKAIANLGTMAVYIKSGLKDFIGELEETYNKMDASDIIELRVENKRLYVVVKKVDESVIRFGYYNDVDDNDDKTDSNK